MVKNLLFLFSLLGLVPAHTQSVSKLVKSPSRKIALEFSLNEQGAPQYNVQWAGKPVLAPSSLGLSGIEADFSQQLTLIHAEKSTHKETWKPVWGETSQITDHHNELLVALKNRKGQQINIRFRVFNDGIGIRYEIPKQENLQTFHTTDDLTGFALTEDPLCWWIPGDYDSNEHVYATTKVSQINTARYEQEKNIVTKHIVDPHNVQTPLTLRTAEGVHLAIAEAALADYPAMHLRLNPQTLNFQSFLIPSPQPEIKSVNTAPFHTPWRVVIISPNAAGLIDSKLILNLNEPCRIKETDWIKPLKYVGVWWEMHVGTGAWDYLSNGVPHGRHSANTANVRKYIDFAARHGFDGVLVEGWNTGWENWYNQLKDEVFSFTTPYPDYDIDFLHQYAKEKGVRLIMHHETSSAVLSYERQMDSAYAYMQRYDMNAVKTGYVGKIIPRGEWHDGQWMVNHYLRVAQKTADYKIMLDAHEPVRPSGLHRTYPNWLACEAARGNEFNAWSAGNPPEHETILPFTRILGGPMDYTPGIFEVRMSAYDKNKTEIVHTTVAKQLALYVTLYSPLQMAADLPENYEKRLDVFQFIRDVPVNWAESRVLKAEVGDYLAIARQDKNSNNWFVGAITDENARNFDLKLKFLETGKTYEATIYADGAEAHWQNNPYPVAISRKVVRKNDVISLRLAAGGGAAISLKAR